MHRTTIAANLNVENMNFAEDAKGRRTGMTKQEARKQLKCRHCVFLDSETEICLCEDPDSEDCPKVGEQE